MCDKCARGRDTRRTKATAKKWVECDGTATDNCERKNICVEERHGTVNGRWWMAKPKERRKIANNERNNNKELLKVHIPFISSSICVVSPASRHADFTSVLRAKIIKIIRLRRRRRWRRRPTHEQDGKKYTISNRFKLGEWERKRKEEKNPEKWPPDIVNFFFHFIFPRTARQPLATTTMRDKRDAVKHQLPVRMRAPEMRAHLN